MSNERSNARLDALRDAMVRHTQTHPLRIEPRHRIGGGYEFDQGTRCDGCKGIVLGGQLHTMGLCGACRLRRCW